MRKTKFFTDIKYKNAKQTIKLYGYRSIFYKYFKLFMVCVALPIILLSSVIFVYYSKTMYAQTVYSLSSAFDRTAINLSNMLTETRKTYFTYTNNNNLLSFVSRPDIQSDTSNIPEIITSLRNSATVSEYIDSIYVYSMQNHYVLSSSNGNYIENFPDRAWYDYYIKTHKSRFMLCSENRILTMCYGVGISALDEGLIVFNINLEKFLKNSASANDTALILTDSDNTVMFSSGEYDKEFIDSFISSRELTEGKQERIDGKFISYMPIDEFNINLIAITDLNTVPTRSLMLIVPLAAFAVSIAFIYILSMNFYNSINQILASILSDSNSDQSDNSANENELAFICRNITNMAGSHKNLEAELAEKAITLKKAQSSALQMQFNPHFLFNTLNLVNTSVLSITKAPCPATKIIGLLSDLLYESLDTSEYLVCILDEISYAKKYIEIESIRYSNCFDSFWDIEEDIEDFKVPKFILQPIIENAFNHGIHKLKNERRGVISISAAKENDNIVFRVKDNGVGMEPDALEDLRKKLESDDIIFERPHIGLFNVNSRIKLIFDKSGGCTVESNSGGTTVTITIPATTA